MIRIYYEDQFQPQMIINDKQKVHHLNKVLKLKCGEEVYLVKKFEVAKCRIKQIDSEQIIVESVAITRENNELRKNVTLGFAPLKGDNTQLVIQKAVELGAHGIELLNFKRNVSKFDSKKAEAKREKFTKIIEGACLQARRNIVPQINVNVDVTKEYLDQYDLVIICYESEKTNYITKYERLINECNNILIVIGPEGGITNEEIELFDAQENVVVVSLGKRILRAETASITSLSIIASFMEGNDENSN